MSPRGGDILLYISPSFARWISFVSVSFVSVRCSLRLSVFDATLNVGQRHRRRANINPALVQSSMTLPPTCRYLCMYVPHDCPGRHEAFARCWYSVGSQYAALDRRCTGFGWTYILFCCDDDGGYCSVDSTHWPSVDLVPGQHRRRWTGIASALGLFHSFAG